MSRTYKDRGPKKYRLGYFWKSRCYTHKILRRRIEREDYMPNGGFYKKLGNKLDPWNGL